MYIGGLGTRGDSFHSHVVDEAGIVARRRLRNFERNVATGAGVQAQRYLIVSICAGRGSDGTDRHKCRLVGRIGHDTHLYSEGVA